MESNRRPHHRIGLQESCESYMSRYQAALERQHAEEAMRLGHLTIQAWTRVRSMLANVRFAFTKA